MDAAELPQVSANIYDRNLAAFGFFSHYCFPSDHG
jgi:hypothetical protein